MAQTQDEIYIKFLDALNAKFDPNQNYPGAYIKAEINAQMARVETKLTIHNINWLKLFKVLFGICVVPVIAILIGLYVISSATTYLTAYQAGLISSRMDNETIFTFVIMSIGIAFIFTGIIIMKINAVASKYRNSDFIKSGVK